MTGFPVVGPRAFSCRLRQNKAGKVCKHPFVLQGSVDDAQKLSGQGNDGFARASSGLHSLIKALQIRTVPGDNQCRLDQRRPPQFAPALMNAAGVFRLVGVRHPWHDTEVAGQPTLIREVVYVPR